MSDTKKGVVKWFNDAKGFGFIEDTTGRDVFVHYSVIDGDGFKTLKDGEEVEYEMKDGPKGLSAVKVQRTARPQTEIIEAGNTDDSGNNDEEDNKSDSAAESVN